MSDYVRTKAIMYPLEKETLDKLGVKDTWDLRDKYEELDDYYNRPLPRFEIECMVANWKGTYYLSYVLEYKYGGGFGEWGRNRLLTPTEQTKYKEIFDKAFPGIEVDPTKLKLVDYCYYNAAESPDFYKQEDSFNSEV